MLTIEKLLILKDVPLFAYTPDEILLEVARCSKSVVVDKGTLIIEKGQTDDIMYIIAKGKIKVHDGENVLAIMGEREIFGELSALSPGKRSASVSALDTTHLLTLDSETLYHLMTLHFSLVHGIIEALCSRCREIAAGGKK